MNLKTVVEVNGEARTYLFGEVTDITIGRNDDNIISPIVESISRHHAKLFFKDGDWYVHDLDSTNGSFLNDSKITKVEKISHGDKLRFGEVTITVSLCQPSAVKDMPAPSASPVVPEKFEKSPATPAAPVTPVAPAAAPAAPAAPAPAPAVPVTDDVPELPVEELAPVASEPPKKDASPISPITPVKPALKRPVLGGGLKSGLKLPPKPNAMRPGLKLPPKPAVGLKPGLKLPGKSAPEEK